MTGTIRRAGDKGDQIKIPILPTLRLVVFVVSSLRYFQLPAPRGYRMRKITMEAHRAPEHFAQNP